MAAPTPKDIYREISGVPLTDFVPNIALRIKLELPITDLMMRQNIPNHKALVVYQIAFAAAMKIFELTKTFPREEVYSLTDQIRRSSRSVCSNIAEAWRKRRYAAAFVSKLSDAEAEAAETQTWLDFAEKCLYVSPEAKKDLSAGYDQILGKLVMMIRHPEK